MSSESPFTGTEPTAADKEAINNILLSLFFEWQDGMTEPGAKRDTELIKPFMELTGVSATSPLCIMYETFAAGVTAGLELSQRIDRIAAEENAGSNTTA